MEENIFNIEKKQHEVTWRCALYC